MDHDALLNGMGDSGLLVRIDQLFECGASQYVDIPQIVAIGDQSAGKSSVLSTLIGKDLPRDSSLCTRYPTKLIFRRSLESSVCITVIPAPTASDSHRQLIRSIKTYSAPTFDDLVIEDIMAEVNSKIGIKDELDSSKSGAIFSGDILQIEITGPKENHYSVIDVPGIFRDPEPGKTTEQDMVFVRNMVESYMASPRSVMLAVIPANCDVATQEILQMAQKFDPEGDRTLGVLTKPDLVDEGAEQQIVDLLQGRTRPLKLGWHVVRNAGQKALNDKRLDKRQLEQEFFHKKRPWNSLDPDVWGTDALVVKLREVLASLVERTFVHVKLDVKRKLTSAQKDLKHLGPERGTRTAQIAFLTELSTKFQALVADALAARTGSNDAFDDHPELKLAPLVMNRMEDFASDMSMHGHTHLLSQAAGKEPVDVFSLKDNYSVTHEGASDHGQTIPPTEPISTRRQEDILEIEDILETAKTLLPHDSIAPDTWLEDLYRGNRGFELGTFNPAILAAAMREQTKNWPCLSRGYTSDIIVMVHRFIQTGLRAICKTDRLVSSLSNYMEAEIREKYENAIQQVDFILDVDRKGQPMTLNHYFHDNLQSSRHTRMSDKISQLKIKHQQIGRSLHSAPISNQQYNVQEIGDIVDSYYKVARKRFVDTICQQATSYFLVNGPSTSLTVFNPTLVSQLTDKQLEEIAGEEDRVKKQREKLNRDIANLEKIRNILSN